MMGLVMYVTTALTTAIPSRRMQMAMGEVMCVTRRQGVADAFNQRVRGSVEKEGEEVNG